MDQPEEGNDGGRWKEVALRVGGVLANAVASIALYGAVILAVYTLTTWVDDSDGDGRGEEAQQALHNAPSRSDGPHAMRAEAFAAGADMDCAGNDADGPRYVQGPVKVPPGDPYDLDRDRDGIGCES